MSKLRILIAGAALATMALASGAAQAGTILGLFNTGVDGGGNPLADGAADSHWVLNVGGTPIVYSNGNYSIPADARFIAAQADGGYSVNPNTYSLTFSVLDPSTASISGNFEADNFASLYLNGHLIAQDLQGTFYSNFQSFTPFSAPSADFVSGANTLSLVVTDTGPPSAALVAFAGVPEPAAWAMMLLGAGMVGAGIRMGRRNHSPTLSEA